MFHLIVNVVCLSIYITCICGLNFLSGSKIFTPIFPFASDYDNKYKTIEIKMKEEKIKLLIINNFLISHYLSA